MTDHDAPDTTPDGRRKAVDAMTAEDHFRAARHHLADISALASPEGREAFAGDDDAATSPLVIQSVLQVAQLHALLGIGLVLSPDAPPEQEPVLDRAG